jgi:hypothetical protein
MDGGDQHLILVGEAPVDGRPRNPSAFRDLLYGRRIDAVLDEEIQSRVEDRSIDIRVSGPPDTPGGGNWGEAACCFH